MKYVGLDVHKNQTAVCVLDENGKKVMARTVRGGAAEVVGVLRKIKEPFAVCFEASTGYGHWHDALAPLARRIVVVHPGHVRLIFHSKRKNDRIDAHKLATLLFLGEIPSVHVPGADVRGWRSLIEFRRRSVADRTRTKNRLRALLRGLGIRARYRLWTKAGRAWLAELDLPTDEQALQRDLLLDEVIHADRKIKRIERQLAVRADGHPGVTLLRTIPGVGPRTAEALVAYIDDPRRFGRNKAIGAYFGLVPSLDASANVARYGHITREGPATARHYLVEAAWQGVRHSPRIKAFYERIKKDNPERRKIALVATAHYLARVMLAMLTSGETWWPEGGAALAA